MDLCILSRIISITDWVMFILRSVLKVVWCPLDIWGKSVLCGGNVKGKALTWEVRERGGGNRSVLGGGDTYHSSIL